MSVLRLFPGPSAGKHAETCSTAKATRGHYACVGITAEPRGLTASQSRPADIFTTAAVPGRSATLDVCVAFSIAAAAHGDAAQAAFDRKLAHYRNEIGELGQQNIHSPPASLDSGREAAFSRHSNTSVRSRHRLQPQRAAPVGRQFLDRRWKHEIQIAFLQRRAAMARAVLPNPSVRAEWLFAGTIYRALHHWGHVPALDGGPWGARP